jgi:putative GTP pyrophosphokinase
MVSKNQVDKAGAFLREWWKMPTEVDDDVRAAVNVVWEYRSGFTYATTKVAANLRYYVSRTGSEFVVAQRWKRLPRILDKMERHPRMRLSQMQDVGGCRAILPDQDAVNKVIEGFTKNWDIITVDDYVTDPRSTGYRAIHAIVKKDERPVEVQLRTTGQQDWADEIERIDGLIPDNLKDGEGPAEVIKYTKMLADVIAAQEAGNPSDSATLVELANMGRLVP